MSDLVDFTYEQETRANEVLEALTKLQQENLIKLEDAAVVTKNQDGKVKIQQTLERALTGSSAAWGGTWGLLIGLLFGGPLLMAVLGVGLGALFGRTVDVGIDNQFIKNIATDLKAGNSAIFILIRDMTVDKVADELSTYGGTLYHTSLSKDAEANLQKALEQDSISQAVMAEHENILK